MIGVRRRCGVAAGRKKKRPQSSHAERGAACETPQTAGTEGRNEE